MTNTLATSQDAPAITLRQRTQSTRVRAYAALALGVLCIGFSAIFTKWANLAGTVHVTGAVSAFYRVIIATIALTIPYGLHLVRVQRRGHRARVYAAANGTAIEPAKSKLSGLRSKVLWGTVIAGLFFALDLGFWNTSLLFTSAANATLLGNLSKSTPTPGGTPTGPGGLPSLPLPTPSLPSLPGLPVQPSPSGTSPTGKVCLPGTICVGSAQRSSSSDGSWRSLYGGGA